jgi:hypothetical protein
MGAIGVASRSYRAMQRLEIRIILASIACVDDVKVGRVFGAVKPT